MTVVVGIDGCRGGWVAVSLREGRFEAAVAAQTFREVLAAFPPATVVGVDIPIGLPPPWPRAADLDAKQTLASATGRVFLTFPRKVYEAGTFSQAVAEARRLTGQGVSQQSWRLGPRILEVEANLDGRVVEVHPELSFHGLAGRVLPSKRTWNGLLARRAALAAAGIELPDDLGPAGRVAADDCLDAAAAAWSAVRVARGEGMTLPARPRRDAPRIWY